MKLNQSFIAIALTILSSAVLAENSTTQPSRYGGTYVEDSKGKKVPTFTDGNVKLPPSNTNVMQGSGEASKQMMRNQALQEQQIRAQQAQNARSSGAESGSYSNEANESQRRRAKMECDSSYGVSQPTAAQRAVYADCMSRANAQFPLENTEQNQRKTNIECDAILGTGRPTISQMAQHAACKNGYPEGSMDAYLQPQAQPQRGAIIPSTGEYLAPAGDGGYIGTKDGRYYAPSGSNGVIDTQSGHYIPTH